MTRRPANGAETDAPYPGFFLRRPSYEGPAYTPGDEAAVIRRAEDRFATHVYGEGFHDWYGDHSTAPVIDPADEADLIRQLRADARRILGGAA